MKVSLNIVKQYIDFDLPPVDELVQRINAQLGGVEEIIDLESKYKDAKIVKVIECEKHPNADKLSSCKIDAGIGELIQVVCGAPNVHAGMWAIWLPPESIVPSTYGTADEFKLGTRELRGIMSNGMLASARELDIGDDHSGIVEITDADMPMGKTLSVGVGFAELFGLNDTIIDIENKMFTHRPDLFGQIGVAREIAGIFGHAFKGPNWYLDAPTFENGTGLAFEVFNDVPKEAPRIMAVAMKNITVQPSPLWLQCALVAMGGKPINNIVDVTNYIMLLTAQPTHAYDYDKIHGHKLGVRMARDGETLPLLNGKTYTLTSDDIVIADGEGVIGLAGIMGGGNSEVSRDTKNIVLEVANFNMYAVRKSSMRHGIFTDALTRFNKGQSPLQNDRVLNLLMMSISDVSSGTQASQVFDKGIKPAGTAAIETTPKFINERLGLTLSSGEITEILGNVELDVQGELSVLPPFWRTDLELPEDIVEEVGRLYGYNKLPRELPRRSTKPASVNTRRELAQAVRDSLARAGANEVLTYSFVHERVLRAAGQGAGDAYQLSNALSPDLQYYRLSLTPSLLDRIHANVKAGYDEFAIFEIGKSHTKNVGLKDGLPIEMSSMALVYTSKSQREGAPFYRAKLFLEFLAGRLGITFAYEPLGDDSTASVVAPFEPKRSAIVSDTKTGAYIGILGEYKKTVGHSFKLPEYTAGFELDAQALLAISEQAGVSYHPLSRYPSVERDISLQVDTAVPYEVALMAVQAAFEATAVQSEITPLDIYQQEGSDTKRITFRIKLSSYEKTLTGEEVSLVMAEAEKKIQTAVNATIV